MKSIYFWPFLFCVLTVCNTIAGTRGDGKAVEIALWTAVRKNSCRVLEPLIDYVQAYNISDKSVEQLHEILRGTSNKRLTPILVHQAFACMSKIINQAASSDINFEQRFGQILHDIAKWVSLDENERILRALHTLLLDVPILPFTRAPRPQSVVFDSVGRRDGEMVGPDHAYDKSLARFAGTTGKLLQGSVVVVDDDGFVTAPGGIAAGSSATRQIGQHAQAEKQDVGTPFVVNGNTGDTTIAGSLNVAGVSTFEGCVGMGGTVTVNGVASPEKFIVQDNGVPLANVLVVDTVAGGVGVKGSPKNGIALFVGGGLQATGDIDANVVDPSDMRIKDNIKPLASTDDMKLLASIEPASFNFKPKWIEKGSGQPGTHYGFVAQDLAKVYPHVVNTLYRNHAAVGHDILAVNQTALMPHVISALKGCLKDLDDIHARLSAIEQCLGVKSKTLITNSGAAYKKGSCVDTSVQEITVH